MGKSYHWFTNLRTPVDETDGVFLNVLGDYRLGPPRVAKEQANHLSFSQLIEAGTVGCYTTVEAISQPRVKALTHWNALGLSKETLEDVSALFNQPEVGEAGPVHDQAEP